VEGRLVGRAVLQPQAPDVGRQVANRTGKLDELVGAWLFVALQDLEAVQLVEASEERVGGPA
jgi:hypothetical protein